MTSAENISIIVALVGGILSFLSPKNETNGLFGIHHCRNFFWGSLDALYRAYLGFHPHFSSKCSGNARWRDSANGVFHWLGNSLFINRLGQWYISKCFSKIGKAFASDSHRRGDLFNHHWTFDCYRIFQNP